MIDTLDELNAALSAMQQAQKREARWTLSPALSARLTDAALTEALLLGLPTAQELRARIVRERGKPMLVTVKLRCRLGLRLAEGDVRTQEEAEVLRIAQRVVDECPAGDASAAFACMVDWLCRNVRYTHTAPGQKGYARLVSATGALLDGQANCQGFADALYLLCRLCGIQCEYRVGRGERRMHAWNRVCLGGQWLEADASRKAREHAGV